MDPSSISDETVIRLLVGDAPSPGVPEETRYTGLPEHHFIRRYVEYAATLTDAPLIFHLGNALAMISAICPPDAAISGPAGSIAANVYVMLLGDSATSRKSSTMRIAQRILANAVPEIIGQTPGSKQGLEAAVAEQPQQILIYPEFSGFLAASQKQAAIQDLKLLLLDIFDGTAISRRLSKESVFCVAPRLTLIGGVAPALFEAHTTTTDLTGGFTSRFIPLRGVRSGFRAPSPPNLAVEAQLSAMLKHIGTGVPNIPVRISDTASSYLWDQWIPTRDAVARRAPAETQGMLMRALAPNLFKVIVLAAVAEISHMFPPSQLRPAAPDGSFLWASDAIVRFAMAFVDAYTAPAAIFLSSVATSPEMRLRRQVLIAVENLCATHPDHIAIEGAIFKEAKMNMRTARTYLETLVAEGTILKIGYSAVGTGYQTPQWVAPSPTSTYAQNLASSSNRGIV